MNEHVHMAPERPAGDWDRTICSSWRVANLITTDPAKVTCGHCRRKLAAKPASPPPAEEAK